MTTITTVSVKDMPKFRSFLEKYIQDSKLGSKLSADDILNKKKFDWVRILAEKKFRQEQEEFERQQQADEDRRQAAIDQEKEGEAAQLAALLQMDLGLTPLSTDDLQLQVGGSSNNVTKIQAEVFEDQIPDGVTALRKKYGELLPNTAFESDSFSITFRRWLWFWKQPMEWYYRMTSQIKKLGSAEEISEFLLDHDNEDGISYIREIVGKNLINEYDQEFLERLRMFNRLFEGINAVIVAWGFNPKEARTDNDSFYKLRSELEVHGGQFYWLTETPKVESADEKKARLEAEAKAEAELQAKDKVFNDLKDKLKVRLIETNPELSENDADQMATKTLKRALRTHKVESFPEITAIFRETTEVRIRAANGKEEEEARAKPYAYAAGMSDDEFQAMINDLRQRREDQAKAQSEADRQRKAVPGYGEEKPATVANRNSKKKGQGNHKNGHKHH